MECFISLYDKDDGYWEDMRKTVYELCNGLLYAWVPTVFQSHSNCSTMLLNVRFEFDQTESPKDLKKKLH